MHCPQGVNMNGHLEQLEWRCEAWTGGRWYVLYIKNSQGWFTEGLCLQKPTHTQTKNKDNLLRRLNEVHLCQMERQEQRVSPVWLHEYAGTGVSGTRWKIQAGEVANGQFSSTQCDTYIHYACVTCITCYVLVKKATQSRAIWSSTIGTLHVNGNYEPFEHDSYFIITVKTFFLLAPDWPAFTPLLTFVTAGIEKKEEKRKKIPCCQVNRFFFRKTVATPVSSSWLPDIFPQCLLANLKLSVHQTWLVKPCPRSFS